MTRGRLRYLQTAFRAVEKQFLIKHLWLFGIVATVPSLLLSITPLHLKPLPTLLHLGVLLGLLAHILLHNPRHRPLPDGLACPACSRHLLGRFGKRALATGECPRCGQELFNG